MQRRDILRTAGLAAGLALAGGPASARPRSGTDDRWFLDWLPRGLVESGTDYSFGTSPTANGPGASARRHVNLVTDHAVLSVSVGVDPDDARERLRADGYDRLPGPGRESYARSVGARHRVATLTEEAVITGFGPAVDPVAGRIRAVADADGTTEPGGVLERLFEHVLPARHLSVDVRPAAGIAGVGERIVVDGDRSRLRTVVLPDPSVDGRSAGEYLPDIGSVDGVRSSTRTHDGRALVREATVRTDILRDRLEGSHGV